MIDYLIEKRSCRPRFSSLYQIKILSRLATDYDFLSFLKPRYQQHHNEKKHNCYLALNSLFHKLHTSFSHAPHSPKLRTYSIARPLDVRLRHKSPAMNESNVCFYCFGLRVYYVNSKITF